MQTNIEIDSRWDNIWDVFPTEMEQFQSYLDSKKGISLVYADILGLINPEEDLSLEFSYAITQSIVDGMIEVRFIDGNIIYSRLIKRDGNTFVLSDQELIEIMDVCRRSDEPFVHCMLDQITLKFLDQLID